MPEIERIGDQADPDERREPQQAPDLRLLAVAGDDDCRSAQGGDQRGHAGKRSRVREQEGARHDAGEAERAQDLGDRLRELDLVDGESEQSANEQGPSAAVRHIECVGRLSGGKNLERHERRDHGADDDHDRRFARQPRHQQKQHQRPDQVELLLDRQRPGMQQRPLLRFEREIVGRAVEMKIRPEQGGGGEAPAELAHLFGRHDEISRGEGDEDDAGQRRHDAPRAPGEEIRQ